jgi:hypothetical protein
MHACMVWVLRGPQCSKTGIMRPGVKQSGDMMRKALAGPWLSLGASASTCATATGKAMATSPAQAEAWAESAWLGQPGGEWLPHCVRGCTHVDSSTVACHHTLYQCGSDCVSASAPRWAGARGTLHACACHDGIHGIAILALELMSARCQA